MGENPILNDKINTFYYIFWNNKNLFVDNLLLKQVYYIGYKLR